MRGLALVIALVGVRLLPGQSGAVANLPPQPAGANDLLSVYVYRAPELTRTVRVDDQGRIRLPMLEQPIPVAGLMPSQIEQAIAQALKDAGLFVDPIVEVTIAQYASRPVSVVGAVRKPVTFQVEGKVTLLDALARAEGLSDQAGEYVLLTIPAGRNGRAHPTIRRIPVKELIDGANPEFNMELRGGEEIRIPEAGRVYVLGNVRQPGAYPVRDSNEATLMKVLALAGGLDRFHSKFAYIYRRQPGATQLREIEVPLAKIMERKLPDVPLEANDVLYIPDNKGRRRAVAIIDRAVGFGATTASGILIWRTR